MILAKKVKRGEVLLMEGFLTFDPYSFSILTSTISFGAVFFSLCFDHIERQSMYNFNRPIVFFTVGFY